MDDYEYSDIEDDEECRHGEEFEVGEESVFDHVEIIFVISLSCSLIV